MFQISLHRKGVELPVLLIFTLVFSAVPSFFNQTFSNWLLNRCCRLHIMCIYHQTIALPCCVLCVLCSPDTEFGLSLNGKEPLSDTGQTLASCGIVSGDLICVILPQSCPAPGLSLPTTSQRPTSSSKAPHKMQEPSTSTPPQRSAEVRL